MSIRRPDENGKLKMLFARRLSMRSDLSLRLLASALIVLVVVSTIVAIVLVRLNSAAAIGKLNDAESYFLARTALVEQDWQKHANIFRNQLEIARALDTTDPAALRAKFISYATIFSVDSEFTHAFLYGNDDALLANYKTRSQDDLVGASRTVAKDKSGWLFSESDRVLYRAVESPIRVGGKTGRVILFFRIDNTFLAQLVFPDTSIELQWLGKGIASGEINRLRVSPVSDATNKDLAKSRTINWHNAATSPQLTITSTIRAPASPANGLILVAFTVGTIVLVGWWLLGAWLDVQAKRLDGLGQALAEFSADAIISERVTQNLYTARADSDDEVSRLSRNTLNMMIDIETARKAQRKATDSLLLEKALNAQIIDVSPIGISIYNDVGDCIKANAAIANHVGVAIDEILGQDVRSLAGWPTPRALAMAELTLTQKVVCSDVFDVVLPDGRRTSLNMTFCPLQMGDESHLMLLTADITDIKNTERALAESELKYRSLVSQAADAIFVTSADGKITDINETGLTILGATRDQVLGRTIEHFVDEDIEAAPIGYADLARGLTVRRERRLRRIDGSTFIADVSARLTSGGSVIGILRDTTERRRMDTEMAELNATLEQKVLARTEDLERANKELEAFAFAVSHDLRAPLRHIDGFGALLEATAVASLDTTAATYLAKIRASTARMETLIDDLLSLSRVSGGSMTWTPVNVTAMAHEVIRELTPAAAEREIEWHVQPGIVVEADPGLLRIVLTNLLSNAVKYTRQQPHAKIDVSAKQLSDGVELKVADNGAGFDMKYAEKLFQPFQRLHSAGEFEGTGIGLATVARIVHRHHGTIVGSGVPGKGATFTITFPGRQN